MKKKLVKDNSRKKQAFFVQANDEMVYAGFPLVPETETDGYVYGAITDYMEMDSPEGCTFGDGFVQAADCTRAGLEWIVGTDEKIVTLIPPDKERWGVYEITFPRPIQRREDLVSNFRSVLPLLIKKYEESKL